MRTLAVPNRNHRCRWSGFNGSIYFCFVLFFWDHFPTGNYSPTQINILKTNSTGTKTRGVHCVRSDDGTPASQSSCTDKKPATSMECNTQKCPTEYVKSNNFK